MSKIFSSGIFLGCVAETAELLAIDGRRATRDDGAAARLQRRDARQPSRNIRANALPSTGGEDITIQSLRDEACRNTAYELLAKTDRRAVDVAITLGYSDPGLGRRAR
jgi:hypothetical protein